MAEFKTSCIKCNVNITPTNWSRHVRSLKHQRNDPDGDIPPRRWGRPKTNLILILTNPKLIVEDVMLHVKTSFHKPKSTT
jgi:hypothetical protein